MTDVSDRHENTARKSGLRSRPGAARGRDGEGTAHGADPGAGTRAAGCGAGDGDAARTTTEPGRSTTRVTRRARTEKHDRGTDASPAGKRTRLPTEDQTGSQPHAEGGRRSWIAEAAETEGRAAPCASSRRGEGRAQRGEGLTEALALPAQGAAQRHPRTRTLGLDHL